MKRPLDWLFSFCIVVAALCLQQHDRVSALSATVTVNGNQDECYRFRTPTSWDKDRKRNPRYLWGNFELMNRDEAFATPGPFVVFLATDNMETILYRSPGRRSHSGHFDVELEANRVYWFCIANRWINAKTLNSGGEMDDIQEEEDGGDGPAYQSRTVGFSMDIVTADQFDYTDFGGIENVLGDIGETEISKAHRDAKERSSKWQRIGSSLTQRLKDMKHHFNYMRTREQHHRSITEQTFTDILLWSLAQAAVVAVVALGQIFFFRRYLERKNRYSVIA